MLSDPLAITYDGNAKSLPRVYTKGSGTRYRTADGEFEVSISEFSVLPDGRRVDITLTRRLPDPTPTNPFDGTREVKNSFTLGFTVDTTRAESSVDIPKLRTALLAFVDSTVQSRLISGEK